jgi:hypothetical protein
MFIIIQILKAKIDGFTSPKDVRDYLTQLHSLPEEQLTKFIRVILTQEIDSISWHGLSFAGHTLPSGQKVVSNTTYFLSKISTSFAADKIIKILQLTYAEKEVLGVFIIKTTTVYIEFFKKLYNSLMYTEDSSKLENIQTIVQKTDPNNFLLISYGKTERSSGFRLTTTLKDTKLVINIVHNDFKDAEGNPITIRLFQIAVDGTTLKPISKLAKSTDGEPFYINGGDELFFVEAYRLRSELGKSAQGGQQKRRTKLIVTSITNNSFW